jgi:hypothetical protein
MVATWDEGDWDDDGVFDTRDVVRRCRPVNMKAPRKAIRNPNGPPMMFSLI